MGRVVLRMLLAAALAGVLVTLSAACEEEDTCGNYVLDDSEDCDPTFDDAPCCNPDCTWNADPSTFDEGDEGDCFDCVFCAIIFVCQARVNAHAGADSAALNDCRDACDPAAQDYLACREACCEAHPEAAASEEAVYLCPFCEHCAVSCASACAYFQSQACGGAAG